MNARVIAGAMRLKSGGLVLWRGFRPIPVLLTAALIGLSVAVLLWTMLNPLLELLAEALTWIVGKLRVWFTNVSDPPDVKSYKNIGIGVGAFGVLVVLSTLKDTHQSLTALALKWMKPDRATLLPAFSSVTVAFTALGLSVYGIGELSEKRPPATIAFDSASIPPAVVSPDSGAVTFYVSFQEEGGRQTLTQAGHESVTLRPSDRDFLQRLAMGLQKCRSGNRIPRLTVRGFASSSYWSGAAGELADLEQNNPQDSIIHGAVMETTGYAKKDANQVDWNLAVARAFNVYLANRRRAAVLDALALPSSGVEVDTAGLWSSYSEMDNALAIEDRGVTGQAASAGILTRSVAVSITDPAACSRAPQFARVELTLPGA
jgi:hypothetical protein